MAYGSVKGGKSYMDKAGFVCNILSAPFARGGGAISWKLSSRDHGNGLPSLRNKYSALPSFFAQGGGKKAAFA